MRTERSTNPSCFARVEGRAVAVDFDGGDFGRGRSATYRAIDLIRRFALSFKDRSLPAWRHWWDSGCSTSRSARCLSRMTSVKPIKARSSREEVAYQRRASIIARRPDIEATTDMPPHCTLMLRQDVGYLCPDSALRPSDASRKNPPIPDKYVRICVQRAFTTRLVALQLLRFGDPESIERAEGS